jgi:hypothetical protein
VTRFMNKCIHTPSQEVKAIVEMEDQEEHEPQAHHRPPQALQDSGHPTCGALTNGDEDCQ